ncbi:MAG: hypothetical protein QXK47_00675 [Candidatus Bathyarchaeia archaeon]
MTKYLWMNTKSLLTNPYLIFWSILFIEFWVFMWAYVFGNYVPQMEEAVRLYTAAAFGNLLMLSLSSASIGISSTLLYGSKSIRYVTKYTRLSPTRFLIENFASALIVLLAISAIMFLSIVGVFHIKFGLTLLPANLAGLLSSIFLGTVFIYTEAFFLHSVVIVLRSPKSAQFIFFLPLIFSFIAYAALWIDFGNIAYISPFNCIVSTCYYYFSGKAPPTGKFFIDMQDGRVFVDVNMALASLITWSIILTVLDIFLLRKMKGVSIEELRTV